MYGKAGIRNRNLNWDRGEQGSTETSSRYLCGNKIQDGVLCYHCFEKFSAQWSWYQRYTHIRKVTCKKNGKCILLLFLVVINCDCSCRSSNFRQMETTTNPKVLIPPFHPRSKILPPLTSAQLAEATPIKLQETAHLNKVNKLNKHLKSPISLQYIHRNYHVLKEADMVLAFTLFQPESKMCFGATGWDVEMAKLLHKILCLWCGKSDLVLVQTWSRFILKLWSNVRRTICFTDLPRTAIVGIKNIYDFPIALLEVNDTFKHSLMML